MHHPLGNPLVIEWKIFSRKRKVLQRARAALADPQQIRVIRDNGSLLGRQAGGGRPRPGLWLLVVVAVCQLSVGHRDRQA